MCSLVFVDIKSLEMEAAVGFEMPGTTCSLTASLLSRRES